VPGRRSMRHAAKTSAPATGTTRPASTHQEGTLELPANLTVTEPPGGTCPVHRWKLRPSMTWLSARASVPPLTRASRSSRSRFTGPPPDPAANSSRPRVGTTAYSSESCFCPGASGATTLTVSPSRTIASGDRSLSPTSMPPVPGGSVIVHDGCAESGATRARRPSFRRTIRSSTARAPSGPGRGTTMCRASTATGAVLDVSYARSRIVVSGRSGLVWTGGEKYSIPP
jgi:hypothetical protein